MTLPSQESAETGRICYETFAGLLGWKFRGVALPPWPDLPQYEQEAFRAGAHDVIQKGWVQAQPGKHRR
jgi:hypothetical protein